MKKIIIIALFVSLLRIVFPHQVMAVTNGDLNGDGKVDFTDFNKMVAEFGHPYTIFDYNILVGNFGSSQPTPTPTPFPTPIVTDPPITRNVMVIDFNPIIESQGNKRLREIKHWNDPEMLESQYIKDMQTVSGGYLNYHIVTRLSNIDAYPTKNNGYVFTDEEYFSSLPNPDANARALINYLKVLNDYDVCGKVNRGEIDELWLWGGPGFGYLEAIMAGTGSYSTNGPPITGTSCTKSLHIMGFSYERPTPYMLEDMGHRVEGTMIHLFYGWAFNYGPPSVSAPAVLTDWDIFTAKKYDPWIPAGCGFIHGSLNKPTYDPNNYWSYDYSSQNIIASTCNDWLNYPNLTGATQQINCSAWNCNNTYDHDKYEFEKWWLMHLPHAAGQTDGKWNNWWRYVVNSD